jgi:hypothetical protein
VQHGRVAHHRFDQRAGGVGIHVPQRFLHAEGEDVGVALQGLVEHCARGLALLHADQEITAHQAGTTRPPNTISSSAPYSERPYSRSRRIGSARLAIRDMDLGSSMAGRTAAPGGGSFFVSVG